MKRFGQKLLIKQDQINKLIFSENEKSFVFKIPFTRGGVGDSLGQASTYQVYLSSSDPSSFIPDSLSTVNLSSVTYYSNIPSLSATYPAFSAYNALDLGCKVFFDYESKSVQVGLGALSGIATGEFKFIITSPGGYNLFPKASINDPFYIQSVNVSRTPERTPSSTPNSTATPTLTPTNTKTKTKTPTSTPTPTKTVTSTTTATPTVGVSATSTVTQTITPTSTNTQTQTPTQTLTPTNTPTQTQTPTNTPTQTQTPTNTPTQSQTPTNTPTQTPTQTQTPNTTPTRTPSRTATATKTFNASKTSTNTPTNTNTRTKTSSRTPTQSHTPTRTSSNSPTPTNTITRTNTGSITSGLIMYLDADNSSSTGTVNEWTDISSNTNNGALSGDVFFNTGSTQNSIKNYTFELNSSIDLNSSSVTSLSTGDFTYIIWAKIYSLNSGSSILLSNLNNTDGDFTFGFNNNYFGYYNDNLGWTYDTSFSLQTGFWYQFALSRSSSTSRLYINGVTNTSTTDNYNYNSSVLPKLGSTANGSGDLDGQIAIVKTYDQGLSTSQILDSFNSLKHRFYLPEVTQTPTQSRTPTQTSSVTVSKSQTPTQTPTPTFGSSPTSTPTNTKSITTSRTPTGTSTSTPTYTATNTRNWTHTRTATQTRTSSRTATQTKTKTSTKTPTQTPTSTITATQSVTPGNTPTETRTPTLTRSITPSQTATISYTPTRMATTATPTQTPTHTYTRSYTPTETKTRTSTQASYSCCHLTMQVDASNVNSYPGSGNVWCDIQRNNDLCICGSPQYNIVTGPSNNFCLTGSSDCMVCGYQLAKNTSIPGTEAGPIQDNYTYSFIFWIKVRSDISSSPSNFTVPFVTDYNNQPNVCYFMMGIRGTGDTLNAGKLDFWEQDNDGNEIFARTSTTYNDNSWHQVAFVADSSKLKIYVDGALRATSDADRPSGIITNGTPMKWFNGNNSNLDADIAIIKTYSGIALSQSNIVSTFNVLRPRFSLGPITPTPTNTRTSTQSRTRTNTPTLTPTSTRTPTQTPTPTPGPTSTPTSTQTPTQTRTKSQTPTRTPTYTRSPTQTPTQTRTSSKTPDQTNTPTQTRTVSQTNTNTPTGTQTVTPSTGSYYIRATGGSEVQCNGFRYHFFCTTDFTNCVDTLYINNLASNTVYNTIEYLIVAGGGAAGCSKFGGEQGGGGGAGGMLTGTLSASLGTHFVQTGGAGNNSYFGSLSACRGGKGAVIYSCSSSLVNGGSGGGSGAAQFVCQNAGSGIAGQGNDGGSGPRFDNSGTSCTGGGGGAGGCGTGSTDTPISKGGDGLCTNMIYGCQCWFAGGGAGGNGSAGCGGGGAPCCTGTDGTGGGGGARGFGNADPGARGGSGIVVIKYPFPDSPGTTPTPTNTSTQTPTPTKTPSSHNNQIYVRYYDE